MARRQTPRKRSGGKFQVKGMYLWIVGGVVLLLLLYMLARSLSTAVGVPPLTPFLANSEINLKALTRMLGDIELDRAALDALPAEELTSFIEIDSLISERSWPQAREQLRRLAKNAPPDRASVAHSYLGFCYHESNSPDYSLREFRALLADSALDPGRRAGTAFCAGYLYQARGLPDSSVAFYELARGVLAGSPDDNAIMPSLLNNYGLALESTGDSLSGLRLFMEAAAFIDTTAESREARVVRENIRRLSHLAEAPVEPARTD